MTKNLPTAAVVILSSPKPTWSAWAGVRSSKVISRSVLDLGRYFKFCNSLMPVFLQKKSSHKYMLRIFYGESEGKYKCLVSSHIQKSYKNPSHVVPLQVEGSFHDFLLELVE